MGSPDFVAEALTGWRSLLPSALTACYALDDICALGYCAWVWDVEFTDQFEAWWDTLSVEDQQGIDAAVSVLEERGPGLGRPLVDTVEGSRHPHMKELRVGTIRILFAFDPRRAAILLAGGDKRERWQEFYEQMIPRADDLFDEHLKELESEGAP
jgi:hypothetical protein